LGPLEKFSGKTREGFWEVSNTGLPPTTGFIKRRKSGSKTLGPQLGSNPGDGVPWRNFPRATSGFETFGKRKPGDAATNPNA